MYKTKSRTYFFIIVLIILSIVATGCSGNKNEDRTDGPKVNVDLDNDGVCDLNCDTNNDGKCDKYCDINNDGICDINCAFNGNSECVLNCDTDHDLVADMYVDVNKDLAYNYEDIELIIKSNVSNFKDTVEFYCPVDYGTSDCNSIVTEILKKLADDVLTEPYQDIDKMDLNFDYGNINTLSYRARVTVKYKYILSSQRDINENIDKVIKSEIKSNLGDDKLKIKTIYDYILDNISMCHDDNGELIFPGNNKDYDGICSNAGNLFTTNMANDAGYADLMALFLTKMGYENLRVYGKSHVWNAVKINNIWYHIDVYWGRPISIDGNNTSVMYDYFMLTTKELSAKNDEEHIFDVNKYYMIK